MTPPRPAIQVLDEEFLTIRAKLLELAAALDRLQRAEGDVAGDARRSLIRQGVETLLTDEAGRAERMQVLFSRPYAPDWRDAFGLRDRGEG
jgi:hypothetical protein